MAMENNGGRWKKASIFDYTALDEDGTGALFETSQGKTTQPTLALQSSKYPDNLGAGIAMRVHYRLNPANAVTFTLRFWTYPIDGATKPYGLNSCMIYESPAGQVGDVDYDREVEIPFILGSKGVLWYSVEWSAACGNTTGFICMSGERIE